MQHIFYFHSKLCPLSLASFRTGRMYELILPDLLAWYNLVVIGQADQPIDTVRITMNSMLSAIK